MYISTVRANVHVHVLAYTSGFEGLQKAFQKAKSVIEKEGTTPVFYVRTLVELEDFVQGVSTNHVYTHRDHALLCDCTVCH